MIELIVQLHGGATAVHQVKEGIVTIGRDTDNVIVIADGSVSRRHAEIRADGGIYTLRDLDSANGTTVNGEWITEQMPKDGDIVCFGVIQATWVDRPPPALVAPESVTAVLRPLPVRGRAMVLGVALLIALSVIVFLVHRSHHANSRTQEIASVDKHKGEKTKMFRDKIHQIEDEGNRQSNLIPFGEYPRLETDMFDFRWFDDKAYESFLGKLDLRSKGTNQVAVDIGRFDRSDVDVDLLAYTGELCTQWKSTADLDLSLARYASALYKQHKDPEHPPSQDDIQALLQQWLSKRSEHQALSAKVIAREKATDALLKGRYQMDF